MWEGLPSEAIKYSRDQIYFVLTAVKCVDALITPDSCDTLEDRAYTNSVFPVVVHRGLQSRELSPGVVLCSRHLKFMISESWGKISFLQESDISDSFCIRWLCKLSVHICFSWDLTGWVHKMLKMKGSNHIHCISIKCTLHGTGHFFVQFEGQFEKSGGVLPNSFQTWHFFPL